MTKLKIYDKDQVQDEVHLRLIASDPGGDEVLLAAVDPHSGEALLRGTILSISPRYGVRRLSGLDPSLGLPRNRLGCVEMD